jgi:hypothetical protein
VVPSCSRAPCTSTASSPAGSIPLARSSPSELRARGHAKFLEKDYKACFDAYLAAERLDVETPREAKAEADACYDALQK